MRQRNLCICDGESVYAGHLSEMLEEKKEIRFQIFSCSTYEHAAELAAERVIDILIIGEETPYEERKLILAGKVFVLTHEKEKSFEGNETSIYRYQSIDEIFTQMVQACLDTDHGDLFCITGKKKKDLICIFSPVHRAGKTTFALELGKELARFESTVYLNLEMYAGRGGIFPNEPGQTISDLLYYSRQEDQNLGLRIGMMVRQMQNLDYMMPSLVSADIRSVTSEEWRRFLMQILNQSIYEIVILDISEGVQGLVEILDAAGKVYMPVLDDPVSEGKIKQFEGEIKLMGIDEILNKTEKIHIPEDVQKYARKLAKEYMGRDRP